MAKKFYTIEEAASKLGKSVDQVKDMVAKKQLEEFRDRDRLMLKVDQVDLLAGDDHIPLASDSSELEPLSLAASGTGSSMTLDAKEQTGISILDTDSTEEADANAVTRVTNSPVQLQDPGKSASGSGGLLDLSKEPDDTSLGAGLLDDVYGSETVAQATAAEAPAAGDGGALFETSGSGGGEMAEVGAVAPMMIAAEPFDGMWSGIGGGIAAGMVVALGLGIFAIVSAISGSAGGGIIKMLTEQWYLFAGIGAGAIVLGAVIGMVIGKKS
jgi:hypothetical protein